MIDTHVVSSKEAARELKNAAANAKKGVDRKAAQQRQAQLAEESPKLRQRAKEAPKRIKDVESALPRVYTLELEWQQCPEFVNSSHGSPLVDDVSFPFVF